VRAPDLRLCLAAVAAQELKPVYLISGGDRPKITRALQRLRSHFEENSIEHLNATEASGEDAVAACNALGLFGGGHRLVIVEEVDGRRNADGRLGGGWKVADIRTVTAYLTSPSPDTVLALVGEEVKKDSELGKAAAKTGAVLLYDVAKRELPKWVVEQFKAAGTTVDFETARRLIELVGEKPEELAVEIDKLVTWADGAPVGETEVEALAVRAAEASSFELTDAWGERDVGAVLAAAELLLERSERTRRDELPRLSALLTSHVARVRECRRLEAEGVPAKEAAGRLKRHEFYVRKLYGQAANYSAEELGDATIRLARLDLALKGGSKLPGDLELARTLVEITQPRERRD
jgi:DNA polymerase III delta subunit